MMKDIITLYDDGELEILYFSDNHNVRINKISSGCDYTENELWYCYDHIMSIVKDKRYADCICECISALVNDWFEDYVQQPGYTDIIMHILKMNDINICNMKDEG